MRKILFLTIAWLLSFVGAGAQDFRFVELADGTLMLSYRIYVDEHGYSHRLENSYAGDIVIPEIYEDKLVTSIDELTFDKCVNLTSIVIPSTVDTIGSAFNGCTALKKIIIADSEKELKLPGSLGNYWGLFDTYYNHLNSLDEVYVGRNIVTAGGHSAFANEHIKKLTLGDNVTRLENEAFRNCRGLRSVTLGPNLTSIGRQAFYQCDSLPSLSIPDGVSEIGTEAFIYCRGLESIELPASLARIEGGTFSDCNSLQSIVIPAAVDSIGSSAFYNCNSLVKLSIADCDQPLKIHGSLGNYWGLFDTYYNHLNSLEEVYVGRNVVTAGGHSAFANEHIKKLTVGENVTRLENEAFRNCRGLRSVTLSSNLTSIGRQAFYQCDSLPSLSIPDGVSEIGTEAFVYCRGLESIKLPASLTRIEGGTFSDCNSLQSIIIPAVVDSIGSSAFYNCNSLVKLTIADCNRELKLNGSLGNYWGMFDTYYNHLNSLEEVYVGRNVVTAGDHSAFANEHIKKLTVGENVTRLENEAFRNCRGLRSVTLGPNLTSIGRQAFYQCDSLPSLVIPDGVSEIGYEAFVYCNALETIHVPASLNRIEGGTFSDCNSLQSIIIPAAVDSIGSSAFYNCNSLVKLSIADCDQPLKIHGSLGNYWGMFDTYYNHLNSLEEVYVGRNVVTAGGHSAFANEHIKKLTLGDNVTRLEKEAFRNCRGLRSVTLGPNLTSIGRQAFYQCDSLPSLVIPDGVSEIGYEAFVYCNALETIHLPASLNRIEGNTFYECKSLQSIVIPAAVDSIGSSAFYNCNSLVKLTIADSDRELKLDGSSGNYWGMFDTYYNHLNSLVEVYVGRNLSVTGGHCPFYNENIATLILGGKVTNLYGEDYGYCNPSELHCNAVIPPVCSSPNVFKKIDKQMCNLYVPEASIDAYKEAPVWLEFFNIHSGIENVEMEDELGASSVVEEMERYSLDGRVGGSEHGVNIVRMSDGTVRKVLVK